MPMGTDVGHVFVELVFILQSTPNYTGLSLARQSWKMKNPG